MVEVDGSVRNQWIQRVQAEKNTTRNSLSQFEIDSDILTIQLWHWKAYWALHNYMNLLYCCLFLFIVCGVVSCQHNLTLIVDGNRKNASYLVSIIILSYIAMSFQSIKNPKINILKKQYLTCPFIPLGSSYISFRNRQTGQIHDNCFRGGSRSVIENNSSIHLFFTFVHQ